MQERTALEDQLTAIGRIERELEDQLTLIEEIKQSVGLLRRHL